MDMGDTNYSWDVLGYDSEEYTSVLYKTQELTPMDYGNSLNCHHATYTLDNVVYRLTWSIGGKDSSPIIEKRK